MKTVQGQPAYLNGEVYEHGKISYFPIAFAIKTPIATTVLIVAGIFSLVWANKPRCRDPVLLSALIVFVALYAWVVTTSEVNLGQRHLLPLYPPLFILAGKAANLWVRPVKRALLLVCIAFVGYANVSIFPAYLSYFNELVGGPASGYRYLLDSNLDWGQDLLRLRDYLSDHGDADVKLAYFGSVGPNQYGIRCEALPSHLDFEDQALMLDAGTYIVSLNQLYGLYERQVRDEFWERPANREAYASLTDWLSKPPTPEEPAQRQSERPYAAERLQLARQWRLLNQLKNRPPDDRVGWSMLVYHLSRAEIDTMLSPK